MKDLIRNISIINRYIQKYLDINLKQYDIGSGQFSFLLAIYENEMLTMQELNNILGLDKATVNKSIKKLIDLGYVDIKVDQDDKRVKRVITTNKTNIIINDLYKIRNNCYQLLTQNDKNIDLIIEKLANKSNDYLSSVEDNYDIKIAGLNKLSLLDYPNELSSIVFTSGCNFRCPFCHNKELVFVPENINYYDVDKIYKFLNKRKNVLKAITISGGEPTLQQGLLDFMRKIKSMGYKIKLDTNGYNCDYLENILNSGYIDYVAMDIKNSKDKYAFTCGMENNNFDISKIEKSIELIKQSGIDYEFRTTVVDELHEVEDFYKIAEWIGKVKRYSIQYFKNGDNVIDNNFTSPSEDKIMRIKEVILQISDEVMVKGGE